MEIENVGTTIVGRLRDRPVFVTNGYLRKEDERYPSLECRSLEGQLLWRHTSEEDGLVSGEYIQWLEIPGITEPVVLWAYFPNPQGGEGLHNRGGLFDAATGNRIHRFEKGSNNASFVADVDSDGTPELVYSGQRFVHCLEVPSLSPKWTRDRDVLFCWGYPTPARLGPKGVPGIVWGSEYNLPGGKTSSLVAVDSNGTELWRVDGIPEDLGSTPVFVADVDGDGTAELVKNGLDLVARNRLEANHLYVFSTDGRLVGKIPSLMYSTGLGDLDGDGHIEAFGVVCHRDGGEEARKRKEIRCLDLATGEEEWSVPVSRVGLPAANALAADVDGDGTLEAMVADGNPTFYGHLPGEDWGRIDVISASGNLLESLHFEKWVRRLAMCDLDDDGFNELIVQTDGAPARLHVFRTQAPATRRTWPLPFGNLVHWGGEHRPLLPVPTGTL